MTGMSAFRARPNIHRWWREHKADERWPDNRHRPEELPRSRNYPNLMWIKRISGQPTAGRVDRGLHARAQAELAQDVLHVDLHRGLGDVERTRDQLVAVAARDQQQDLALARREQIGRWATGRFQRRRRGLGRAGTEHRDQLGQHLGADHGFAIQHLDDGLGQLVGLHRLDQVAVGAGAQGRGQIVFVFAHGEHQDAGARRGVFQRGNGVHPAHTVQVVVEQDHVGPGRLRQAAQGLADVARLADHLEALVLRQQGPQAAAKEVVVVDQQQLDAGCGCMGHGAGRVSDSSCRFRPSVPMPRPLTGYGGRVRVTVVPWPGLDTSSTLAPMRSARSRMIFMPTWFSLRCWAVSKPAPLSRTAKRQRAALCTSRLTWLAPACLRTLESASCSTCNTCTCTSAGSGRPWPSSCRRVGKPVWCWNFCSVSCSAASMSSVLVRVLKCTSNSRTSLMLSFRPVSSSSSVELTLSGCCFCTALRSRPVWIFRKASDWAIESCSSRDSRARSSPTAASRSSAAARRPSSALARWLASASSSSVSTALSCTSLRKNRSISPISRCCRRTGTLTRLSKPARAQWRL